MTDSLFPSTSTPIYVIIVMCGPTVPVMELNALKLFLLLLRLILLQISLLLYLLCQQELDCPEFHMWQTMYKCMFKLSVSNVPDTSLSHTINPPNTHASSTNHLNLPLTHPSSVVQKAFQFCRCLGMVIRPMQCSSLQGLSHILLTVQCMITFLYTNTACTWSHYAFLYPFCMLDDLLITFFIFINLTFVLISLTQLCLITLFSFPSPHPFLSLSCGCLQSSLWLVTILLQD